MSPIANVGLLLVNVLGSLLLMIILLRFLLQLVRADFYNPISQLIVKVTNPVLIPLRKIIPGFGGLDIASLVFAFSVQFIIMALIIAIKYGSLSVIPWSYLLVWTPLGLFAAILNIYFWGIIIVAIASWIAPSSYNPALILISQILEPVIRPIRAKMPDLGGIDLSPFVLSLAILIIEFLVLYPLAQMLNYPLGTLPL